MVKPVYFYDLFDAQVYINYLNIPQILLQAFPIKHCSRDNPNIRTTSRKLNQDKLYWCQSYSFSQIYSIKPGYCYVSCHQGQSFLTVGSDGSSVAVSGPYMEAIE